MLSDASEIRSFFSHSSLDLSALADTTPTITFNRNHWSDTIAHSFGNSRASADDAHSEWSTSSNLNSTLADVSRELETHWSAIGESDPSYASLEWIRSVQAAIEGRSLAPGTYSVQVDHDSSDTTTTAIAATVGTTGHTLTDAYSLGTLSSAQALNDFVGNGITDNYYRFALSTPGSLNLSLSNLTADADLELIWDANNNSAIDAGEVIASSSNPGTESELIATNLVAKNYVIHVHQYSGDTSYTLSTSAIPLNVPTGYNTDYGYGLVDAAAAIAHATGQNIPAAVPSLNNTWELNLVNAPAVWARGYSGQGVVVAVVDTGVDTTHPDLNDNIWINAGEIAGNSVDDDKNGFVDDLYGWDFIDKDNTPTDLDGHGTHVAGTIAAEQNGFGVTGVAYSAKILPVRVIGSDGGSSTNVAAGIRYAADRGADVINLSLGGGASSAIADAVKYATQKGALVVMAAGNDAGIQPLFPGNLADRFGIAVGAVDSSKKLASFSDRAGASPLNYVVAPGVNILSTTPNNTYQTYSGTSMATPHVSGVAALVLSANPNLTPAQLTSLLTSDAKPQGITV